MDLHNLIIERDLTPKHVALAQCIHHYTRSKFILSVLNRLGHCISYKTLTKLNNQVLTHIIVTSNEVDVPSNIVRDPSVLIHGAIDNDDFKEDTFDGKSTTHVTAMVLYQPAGIEDMRQFKAEKIPVPETGLKVPEHTLLECQVLKKGPLIKRNPDHFPKPFDHVSQPTDTKQDVSNRGDLIWVLTRLDLESKDNILFPKQALAPGWTPFNQAVSKSDMPVTKIGFCAIFPAPPTTSDAVYTVMSNFLRINDQLGQKYAVLSCDMAVYLLAKLIQLQTNGFERLFLRIGTFHLAKNFLSIIGQYLQDSGFIDIVIESGMYGENTIKSVLHGTHYNRGIRVHKIMYEACRRLQFKEFVEEHIELEGIELPKDLVKKLQTYTMGFKEEASPVFELIEEEHSQFFESFNNFRNEKAAKNETFKYWDQYCDMVELLLDCVKADREGNWNLHINVVKRMIPYCLLFNHYNYVRSHVT